MGIWETSKSALKTTSINIWRNFPHGDFLGVIQEEGAFVHSVFSVWFLCGYQADSFSASFLIFSPSFAVSNLAFTIESTMALTLPR